LLCAAVASSDLYAGKFNRRANLGDKAPGFERLPATDGRSYSLGDFAAARLVVVVIAANHCPISAAYDARLVALDKEYAGRGVQIVAISCSALEQDGLEAMRERGQRSGFKFPCLHDAGQAVGRAYGATATPEVFVLDGERRFAYQGAIDDQWNDPDAVQHAYLRDALAALLAGRTPEPAETRPVGCPIDYPQP
jgi:peroxiredoxin